MGGKCIGRDRLINSCEWGLVYDRGMLVINGECVVLGE